MSLLIFALTGLAVALLALGMERHYKAVFHKAKPGAARRVFKVSGWLLLAASFVIASLDASGVGWVAWIALLAFHGFVVTLAIAYLPRLTR
jgi:hypothetical protein